MIEDANVEEGSRCDQPLGQLEVLGTRLGVAARVVVDENRPRGRFSDQEAKDFRWIDLAGRSPPACNLSLGSCSVLCVDRDYDEVLHWAAHQAPPVPEEHRFAVRERRSGSERRTLAPSRGHGLQA